MSDLRDFFQGASNSIASNVSAPVDGIAWLLRKAGVPVPPNPMGGSDWMAEKGLTQQPQNRTAGLLGEFAGMTAPMVAAAKAPQIAKGLLSLDDKAMDMGRSALENHMVKNGMIQPVIDFPTSFTRAETTEAVRKHAEDFAASLRDMGLRGSVEHSGSIVGPSSYVTVTNPVTGAGTYNTPFRFSNHSKGPIQSQYVREIRGSHADGLNISEYDDFLNALAKVTPEQKLVFDVRQAAEAQALELYNSPLQRAFRLGRRDVSKANQEAIQSGREFSKAFSNSGKPLR